METWFCIMVGTEFCAGASTGFVPWGWEGTGAGAEGNTCVEA